MKCRPFLNGAAEYLSQTKWLEEQYFIASWVRGVLQRCNPLSLCSVREPVLSRCLLGWITYSVQAALCGDTRWQIVSGSSCIINSETRLFLSRAKIRLRHSEGRGNMTDQWSTVQVSTSQRLLTLSSKNLRGGLLQIHRAGCYADKWRLRTRVSSTRRLFFKYVP